MIFIDACLRRPTPRPPVWLMRQAGRYLPEYREIRANYTFLEMCADPELVKEVTLQPILRFDMDAAIIFADILLPLIPMGLGLSFVKGDGPKIERPIRSLEDVRGLQEFQPEEALGYVAEGLRLVRADLAPEKALIGFAGAPFTLACYAIQGHGGNFDSVRRFMFREPAVFDRLMAAFSDMTLAYLEMQVKAGANAVQLFDSWVGQLSPFDYQKCIYPHMVKLLNGLKKLKVPRIYFAKGGCHLRTILALLETDVIGLDWTMPLAESREILGPDIAVQGNLDPMLLFASNEAILNRTSAMMELNEGKPGYIVNLGHGIHKETPISAVETFINCVKSYAP